MMNYEIAGHDSAKAIPAKLTTRMQFLWHLANRIAMKLLEENLIETKNKKELERQLAGCIKMLVTAEDFDVQYQIAPLRTVVRRPNFVSLYITAFIIEKMINHRTIIDIYGTDEEIYQCVNSQVSRMIRM